MEAVTVWKFLHIASMFVAVSILVGQGMLSGVVARSGERPCAALGARGGTMVSDPFR